jgi:hypothetical protein
VTPEELATIRAGAETALDAVHRGWPWPEIDNDLVIGAALKDVSVLVKEVERLQLANADALRTLTGLEPFFEELEKIAPDERALRVVEHTRKAFDQAIDWLINAHAAPRKLP